MIRGAHLYFHSPCFDGIASAVLTMDFLEGTQNWTFDGLHPVDYDRRKQWVSQNFSKPFAVVDFLYHPDADLWADHHQTTFVEPSLQQRFEAEKNPYHIYSPKSGSCAKLLWRMLALRFNHCNKRFSELVRWADKIDAARYGSVEEAINGTHPALNINRTLMVNKDPDYPVWLVRQLRTQSLEEIGLLPAVLEQSNEARRLIQGGLDRVSQAIRLEKSDIAVFDVDSSGVLINRYSPYQIYPNARYSLGVIRNNDSIKITAMRNPWRQFSSVYLGKIFERFGGGGHRRVGSVMLRGSDLYEVQLFVKRLLREIRKEDASSKKGATA